MNYATLKLIHVCAVAVSGCGFVARGLGAWNGAAWVRRRATRTLPHLVDTVLLLSALGMLWTIRLSPWALPWLRAKIIGLVFYIAFGAVALRRLRRQPGQPVALGAWAIALLIFGYIISVALTKSPRGIFSL